MESNEVLHCSLSDSALIKKSHLVGETELHCCTYSLSEIVFLYGPVSMYDSDSLGANM